MAAVLSKDFLKDTLDPLSTECTDYSAWQLPSSGVQAAVVLAFLWWHCVLS